MTKQSLQHYGIKGMRWGVRRKRGSDGRVESDDSKRAKQLKKKKLSELTNKELKELNERMNLERQYSNLTKKDLSRGQKIVNDAINEVGKETVKGVLKEYAPMVAKAAKAFATGFAEGYKSGS